MDIIDLTYSKDPQELYFDWENIDYEMAFEDIYGNILWFSHDVANEPLLAIFTNCAGHREAANKLALIRTPEWDHSHLLRELAA